MAYLTAPRTLAAEGGLRARFAALLADLAERRTRIRLYRQTVSELKSLSSRELADLGLHESQIESIAARAVYGE